FVEQRNVVWPEDVVVGFRRVTQMINRFAYRNWKSIAWLRQYPHKAVLGERTTCPAISLIHTKPVMCSRIIYMLLVEQSHQDAEIKERPHAVTFPPLLTAQPALASRRHLVSGALAIRCDRSLCSAAAA